MLETNGTRALPKNCDVDWITCSPKLQGPSPSVIHPLNIQRIDELKVVFEGSGQDMAQYDAIKATEYRLQPCFTGDKQKDTFITNQTIEYILAHPKWSLSLQTHKVLGVR